MIDEFITFYAAGMDTTGHLIGMVLYRELLAEHMVSPPYVAKAQLGVTGDATQLRINDQVLRITAQSALQPNPSKWMPVITK